MSVLAVPTLVGGVLAHGEILPPPVAALYDYVLAGNGLFVRAQRTGLEALIPVATDSLGPPANAPDPIPGEMRQRAYRTDDGVVFDGLSTLEPHLRLAHTHVPERLVTNMLVLSQSAHAGKLPVETLFHLSWRGQWILEVPVQSQGPGHVLPLDAGFHSSYERALIEIHSHAGGAAYFSAADDRDETGFRLYAVLGDIFNRQPVIRMRIGIYGHRWEVPAAWVFDLPQGIADGA